MSGGAGQAVWGWGCHPCFFCWGGAGQAVVLPMLPQAGIGRCCQRTLLLTACNACAGFGVTFGLALFVVGSVTNIVGTAPVVPTGAIRSTGPGGNGTLGGSGARPRFTGLGFGGLGLLPPEAGGGGGGGGGGRVGRGGGGGGVLGTTGIPLRLSGIAVCLDVVCCTRIASCSLPASM